MTLILILTVIFNISLIVLLAGIAWYACKSANYLKDVWVYFNLASKEQADTNLKLDELLAFLKITFNKNFAEKLEDVIRAKEGLPPTVKVLCDDGKEHELPEDIGF